MYIVNSGTTKKGILGVWKLPPPLNRIDRHFYSTTIEIILQYV